ncbi:hypothetical protein HNV10_00290 [Winogradskyella litoriviva]|uniref:Uncharacterized protein n=1 Tax=Winogradskyella litoriviva TaxID=1220182 RepID=A0ABX2DZ46_9FLAO|nr:hypothetical protein [Winogradskyella litoriviva]NRD21658.1 hypothetical protein [Winogradskyella litoriviva]
MRQYFTLVILLLTTTIYGQKSTLYQNINSRAKELKHNLNKTGDTLIFSCERTIFEVVIYNDDFERVVRVRGKGAKIPIADIPVGRYLVETLLRDKLIVLTLVRNEEIKQQKPTPLITDVATPSEIPTVKTTQPQKSLLKENSINKSNIVAAGKKKRLVRNTAMTVKKKPEVRRIREKKEIATYWIVYIINKGTSTEKTQKLADQETVDYLIRKINIDMKTSTGRQNELSIWKVYDTSEFMLHKRKNKSEYMNIASESFNMEPYFIKENKTEL